jgi:uncharacterized protein YcfJ
MSTASLHKAVRAGVFGTLSSADKAVSQLLAAGFTKDQITVVCSDKAIESHYKDFEHQQPAGSNTDSAVIAGSTIGAALGGLTAIAFGAATGNVPLVIAGATGLLGGGTVGGFVGAMMTRGVEKELANYYDQAVVSGKILVAVELEEPLDQARLAAASQIIDENGADPVKLPEG